MNRSILHCSARWLLVSYGNGTAYSLRKDPPEDAKNMTEDELPKASVFVQGDDATAFMATLTGLTEGTPQLEYEDALSVVYNDYYVDAWGTRESGEAALQIALNERLSTEPVFPDPVPDAIAAGVEDGRPAAWLLRREDGTWRCALGNGTPAAFSYAGIEGSEEVACQQALKAAKTGTEAMQAVFDHARRYLSGPHAGRTVDAYSANFPAQPLRFMSERPVSGNLTAHSITIMWGSAPEEGDEPKTYTFDTEAELEAFLLGVDEMDGWGGWREIEEGQVWCFECNEVMPTNEHGECATCAEEGTCRECGEEYAEAGDGYDGMCPDCADKAEQDDG